MIKAKKILAVLLASATIASVGVCGVPMTVNAASVGNISALKEVAGKYSISFVEPYTSNKSYKATTADNKAVKVRISGVNKATINVNANDKFAIGDTVTVYNRDSNTWSRLGTVTLNKANSSCSVKFSVAKNKNVPIAVVIKNKNGKVLSVQYYTLYLDGNAMFNNKIDIKIKKNTVSRDSSSAKEFSLPIASYGNTDVTFEDLNVDWYNAPKFDIIISKLDEYYKVKVIKEEIQSGNRKITEVKTEDLVQQNGVCTYTSRVPDDGTAIYYTVEVRSANNSLIAKNRYKMLGKYVPMKITTYVTGSSDGSNYLDNVFNTTEDTTKIVRFEDSIKGYKAPLKTKGIKVRVNKNGGSYKDNEICYLYIREGDGAYKLLDSKSFAKTDYLGFNVTLPKANVGYTLKVLIKNSEGNDSIIQEIKNVVAFSDNYLGVTESYNESGGVEKSSIRKEIKTGVVTKSGVVSGDTDNGTLFVVGYNLGCGNYSRQYRLNTYGLQFSNSSVDSAITTVTVTKDGKSSVVYKLKGFGESGWLNIEDLGMTPDFNAIYNIKIETKDENNKVISTWNRKVKFVGASVFNLEVSEIENNNSTLYAKKLVVPLSNNLSVNDKVQYVDSYTSFRIETYNNPYISSFGGTYDTLPINVTGYVYINDTKLCTVEAWQRYGYNNKNFKDICQKYGYFLEANKSYNMTIKLYNKENKKLFVKYNVMFEYINNTIGS